MLLFMDGFDHAAGADGASALLQKWSAGVSAHSLVASPVRTGTGALQGLGSGNFLATKTFAASGGFVVGLAVRLTSSPTGIDLLQVREDTTVHLVVGTESGKLVVRRGASLLATGATTLLINSWYYVEFKGVIHDTAGSYELRIDGVTELAASGIDTRNVGTTGQWNNVRLGSVASTGVFFDDLYVCDLSGSLRNDFLGVCKVETLLPQLGNGSNVGLTPSTGGDHGALVDENPPNTTDYNSSPTVGVKDTYNYPSMALTGAILGIQTNLYVNKSDAAARQVCAVVRAGAIDYDGANVAPGTTFGYFSEVRAVNPNTTVDWTTSDIAALEAGMKVTV